MARPERKTVDFPEWKPQKVTLNKILDNLNKKEALKRFRSSSSAFISKKEVRKIILLRHEKCAVCDTRENLQVDHVLSVYHCFHNNLISFCNTEENLQVLCSKCNQSKKP